MAIVKNHNGTPDGQSDTMVKYSFSGSPTSLYEHVPEPGERRTMTIVVECTLSGRDTVKDGERAIARFKVIDAELGKPAPKPEPDPELNYDDGDPDAAATNYGDYQPDAPEERDTPPPATVFDGGPTFSGTGE